MLPDYPKVKRKIEEDINTFLQNLAREDPLLMLIKEEQQFEGNRMSLRTESGKLDQSYYKEIGGEYKIKREDVIIKGPMAYIENIKKMAEDIKRQKAKLLFDEIKESVDKTGNIVNGKGQPFTFELLMQVLEKVWVDFNEKGNPIMPAIVVPPESGVKLKQKLTEWEANPKYKKRFDEIIEKKRKQWHDRESNRKLVD